MDRRLGWGIEKYILLGIIAITVLNFFNLLSPFWSYVQNVVGGIMISYLIYAASPTELFFGERHTGPDLLIVISYVILNAKEFVINALASLPQLLQAAPSYIRLAHTNLTSSIIFPVSAAEFNSFTLNIAPQAGQLALFAAQNLSIAQQNMVFLISDGARQMALVAAPTTLDGTMLLFYNSVRDYSGLIQEVSLVVGILLLLCVSVYAAYRIPVKRPSILAACGETGKPGPMRVLWLFLLLAGFFVIVFNLLFEWMSVTDDTVLLIVAMLVVVAMLLVRRRFRTGELLEELANIGEEFYVKTIRLFMESRTILLGVSGFLVLHLVTDVGNFLAPAIAGYQTIYVQQLQGSYVPLFTMILRSMGGPGAPLAVPDALAGALVVAAYLLSTVGLILLLCIPGVIWYIIFRIRTTGSHEHLPDWAPWATGAALACIVFYAMIPVFSLSTIQGGEFVGVNIVSTPIQAQPQQLVMPLLSALGIFALCVIIGSLHDRLRRAIMLGPFTAAIIFFGIYVYDYFTSSFVYYASSLVMLLRTQHYIVMPAIFVMFGLTIVFYVTGFFSFLYEIWRD